MLWLFPALAALPAGMQPNRRCPLTPKMKKTLLASLLAMTLLQPLVVYADLPSLPDLGEISDASLSMADEARIGRDFMRAMRDAGDVVEDAEVNDYINVLGHRLSAAVRMPGLQLAACWSALRARASWHRWWGMKPPTSPSAISHA